jgi:hypothetical protein
MIETKLPAAPPSTSALGRPLDPGYISNLVAVLGALATAVASWILSGVLDISFAASPLGAAGAVFLAWAIAREIDPDRNESAYLAMVIAFTLSIFWAPSLLLGFGVLIGTRLVSATVGLPLRNADCLALVGFGVLMGLGWTSTSGVVAIVAGVLLADGFSRRAWITSALTTAAAAVTLWVRSAEMVWESPGLGGPAIVIGLVAALVVSLPVPEPAVTTDVGNRSIARRSIALSRITLLGTIAAAVALTGKVGLEAGLVVAGSALLGTAATAASRRFRKLGSREVPDGGYGRRDNRSHPNWAERLPAR